MDDRWSFLEVDGNVSREQTAKLEQAIWKHLPDLRPLRADQFGEFQRRQRSAA